MLPSQQQRIIDAMHEYADAEDSDIRSREDLQAFYRRERPRLQITGRMLFWGLVGALALGCTAYIFTVLAFAAFGGKS